MYILYTLLFSLSKHKKKSRLRSARVAQCSSVARAQFLSWLKNCDSAVKAPPFGRPWQYLLHFLIIHFLSFPCLLSFFTRNQVSTSFLLIFFLQEEEEGDGDDDINCLSSDRQMLIGGSLTICQTFIKFHTFTNSHCFSLDSVAVVKKCQQSYWRSWVL